MTYRELAKQIDDNLYPEVSAAGSLANALGKALAEIGSPLEASAPVNFLQIARVEGGSRFCQMYIAAHERLFTFDFWTMGVGYGNGACSDLNEAARALHFWITEKPDIAAMQSRFQLFVPREQALAHEAGKAVEYQWTELERSWATPENANAALSPLPLIQAASQQADLRQLFPFTSLYSLHFSRTTGYPFTNDCPFATPIGDGRFRAHSASQAVIGEGSIEEVIEMLIANLPSNCGPAVDGTAEDFASESK